ncbi:hypothetical protein TVAG_214700 [Trichomonas vaginalis G3]|uniref:Uncharacterized protein n=1 Tax=Trichomonas vaginalis (strain ATCC PRA-98 / G3) TaxID=412133 RepID=A2DK74_TRIV3|nr:regulator of chromosome condensation 1/beta-lactamase-inhibitor protein II family [Trichomonas vaginalis G3]EAY19245.1 hypothetical protein TVAG_214700 [Trichomonas vaginalis G3]KAI5548538.1 regulator of chromosome condensation 1/beta-lactamase-inhibitor protein II family [Trichomonas vaginalis G3]|eukprot:XP_001580231.1 hypothetical protein [Trichomonas vaginalis G3]
MSSRISDGFFCPLKKGFGGPQGKQTFISLDGKKPLILDGSGDHYVFIDKSGKAYGFGKNDKHQITKNAGCNISLPLQIDISEDLYEIACGNGFTAAITKTNKLIVLGDEYSNIKPENLSGPRGLSAFGTKLAFITETNNITIYTDSQNSIKMTAPGQLITCKINSSVVSAMTSKGDVYVGKYGEQMKLIANGSSLFCSSESILVVQNSLKLIVYHNGIITEYYLPAGFECVNAGCEHGDVFILDISGSLAHASNKNRNFSTISSNFVSLSSMPIHGPISTFCLLGKRFLFIQGHPIQPLKSGVAIPIPQETKIDIGDTSDTFLASANDVTFFANRRSSFDDVSSALIPLGHIGDTYFTSLNRPITLDSSDELLFSVNLLAGDEVTIGKTKAVVAGYASGSLWVMPEGQKRVYAVCDFELSQIQDYIVLNNRPGHTLLELNINGSQVFADTTREFVQTFGYAVGDLLWVPQRGTCEFLGVYANMLVILDISTRYVFTQDPIKFKVLRRNTDELPHTRDVMKIDGERITLDISCTGNRLFVPTDRVITPIGFATILGFADTCYVQTDEMRINGYKAAPVSALDMQLVRRISMPAERTIETVDGHSVTVSLDTESATDGIMAGDILAIGTTYARAVGVNEDGWYAIFIGDNKARILPPSNSVNIVYRSDFMATRNDAQGLQVGSPGIGESLILPGDIVDMKGFNNCEFMGYNDTSMVFVSHETGELLSLTFSTALLPDLFTVVKRPAMEFLGMPKVQQDNK